MAKKQEKNESQREMSIGISKTLDESQREIEERFLYRITRTRRLSNLANANNQSGAAEQAKRYARLIKLFSGFSNKLCVTLHAAEINRDFAEASVRDLEDILFRRNRDIEKKKIGHIQVKKNRR